MKKVLLLLVGAVLALSYCQKNIGGPTESKIDRLLSIELEIGISKSRIEEVLISNEFAFTFDDTLNRYQVVRKNLDESCFRTVLYDCGIQIYIYLNDNRQYQYHEVLVLYDGL
jgi:hypothetical protein